MADQAGTRPFRSQFCQRMITLNGLEQNDFLHWVFHPGMLFDSSLTWWNPGGRRPSRHEGLDLCLYAGRTGRTHSLAAGMLVPAFASGTVAGVIDDFVGQSIVVRADNALVIIQAHVLPHPAIQPGVRIRTQEPIATIAKPGVRPSGLLPHVHITLGKPHPGVDLRSLTWPELNAGKGLELFDPLGFMDCNHQVLPEHHPL